MRRTLLAAIAAAIAFLLVVPVASGWSWPVDGPVLRSFSLGADVYAAGQHRGIDVGAPAGDGVRAPAAGLVSFVGAVPGGGRALTIQTGDGYAVTLLQLGSAEVARGANVAEGDLVGRIGESSDAVTTAPHVHLGVRIVTDPDGYVDPLGLLPERPVVAAPEPTPAPAPAPAPVPAAIAPAGDSAVPASLPPSLPVAAAETAEPTGAAEPSASVSAAPAASISARSPRPAAGTRPGAAAKAADEARRARAAAPLRTPSRSVGARPPASTSARGALARSHAARVTWARAVAPVQAPAERLERRHASRIMPAAPRVVAAAPRRHSVPRDAIRPQVRATPTPPLALAATSSDSNGNGADTGWILLLLAVFAAGVAGIAARIAHRAAPIIDGDELLPDDTDLLRQLDAPHRPRVHDDHGRHLRPPSQAARGGDVLPHGRRRARGQGGPCRSGRGAHGPAVRGPDRAGLARARPKRERRAELLHPDDR